MTGRIALAFVGLWPAAPAELRFEIVPRETSGIRWTHDNAASAAKHLPETVGAGVAVLDYDGDGWQDLYFVNSGASEFHKPAKAARNALYRNRGNGTFEDVSEQAGVAGGRFGMGAAAADCDSDGDADLFVTNYGSNVLYRNRGDGKFEDATAAAGLNANGWFTHATWFDYDKDGNLDLFVSSFVAYTAEENRYCGDPEAKRQHYCIPRVFRPTPSRLYRNLGGCRFQDVSAETGIAAVSGKAFASVATDINNDGWLDLFVANDTIANFLFVNEGGRKFREIGLAAGVAYSEAGNPRSGMGVDAADVDGDGWQDLFVANIDQEMFSLYRNQRGVDFADDSAEIRRATRLVSGWGLRFADFDNDGDPDLFLVNGHPDDMISVVKPLVSYEEPPLYFRNENGRFVDASGGAGAVFARKFPGRGMATLDFDNDGDLDVVVTNNGAAPVLLRNDGGNARAWIGVELVASASNPSAVGAMLRWKAGGKEWSRLRTAGGSYLSSHDSREIIGLGAASHAEWIEVRWPSGKVDRLDKPPVGKYLKLTEGKNVPLSLERLIDLGRFDEARQGIAELRASSPDSPRLALLEGMIFYREGKAADALRVLQPSVDGGAAPAASFKLAALCLVALGKSREAGGYIREAVRLAPGDAMARYYLGLHAIETRDFETATSAFTETIRLSPGYPDGYTMLGLAIEESGRADDALAHYRKGADLNARMKMRRDSPHIYLARYLHTRTRYEEALTAVEPALEANPRSAEAWLLAGKIRADLGRHDAAIEALDRAQGLAPRDKRVRYQRMKVYQKMGRLEDMRREKEAFDRMSETELNLWESAVRGGQN